ncbi:MAG: 7TM diverse intracellular signaling domain-containing protein [Flavihumibacter sp.]
MKRSRIILLLLLLVRGSLQAQPYTDSLFTFSSPLPPSAIQGHIPTIRYSAHGPERIDFGIARPGRWYYLLIKTSVPAQEQYVLSIDNTSIDEVRLFSFDNQQPGSNAYTGGNLVPYQSGRRYVWHTLALPENQRENLVLAAFFDRGKNINLDYQLLPEAALDRLQTVYDRLIWFYLGMVSLIIMTVVFGWLVLRNISLRYYALYLASLTAWVLAHYGYLYPFFYPRLPAFNAIAKPLITSCSLLFICCLVRHLFSQHLRSDRLSRLLLHYMIAAGIAMPASFILFMLLPWQSGAETVFNVAWHICFMASFGCLLLVLIRLFDKSRTAKLFALAIAVVAAMSVYQAVSNSGILFNHSLNEHGILLSSIIEILVLSYAVFVSVRQERQQVMAQISQLEDAHLQTLTQLVTVQDNERKRIAGELHDSIGPMLAAIKINFQRIATQKLQEKPLDELIGKTTDIIDNSMQEIRNISHQLMPKELINKGLALSLTEYIQNLQEVNNIPIHFTHNISVSLQKDVLLNVYRIMSELLVNAARHSQAAQITASIATPNGRIEAMVKDEGLGFDPLEANDLSSLGLKSIRSRVEYLKGSLQIASAAGQGTCVVISIPQAAAPPGTAS